MFHSKNIKQGDDLIKISHIEINNFIGITELKLDLGKVNIVTGRKGEGKTSIIQGIQKGFTNKSERMEVIRHGEEEATIFIQTDNGMEISRKIRNGKADYLKVSQPGEAVPSSEKFLKQFINGDLFKPLEFITRNSVEQAKIILNLLDIPWTMEDISNWFGELPDVNYQSHILQVLGQIVSFYFDQRASINSEIVVLKAQIAGYRNELPANYDGNEWREKKVAEYYKAVHDAEQVNKSIDNAKNLIEGLEGRIATVTAEAETEKQSRINFMNQKRGEVKEFKAFLENNIVTTRGLVDQADEKIKQSDDTHSLGYEREWQQLKDGYDLKLKELDELYAIKTRESRKLILDGAIINEKLITNYEQSIATKEQELLSIDELETQSLLAVSEKTAERIKTEDAKVGNARKTLEETTAINVEPLTLAADQVAHMQSYLRDFDLMASMIREKLAPKEELSKTLTQRIEKGREMPKELLKIAALPIPGITVDSDGNIRQDGTLIDGLSEGEQLELAFRVAKAQAGELKLICLDGWNKINPSDREWIEKEIAEDDFQYIVLETTEGDLNVKIEGGIK